MLLNLLIILFAAIALLALLDFSVMLGVFLMNGCRWPTRTEYFNHVPAVALGLLGGAGVYCLTVIVCLL